MDGTKYYKGNTQISIPSGAIKSVFSYLFQPHLSLFQFLLVRLRVTIVNYPQAKDFISIPSGAIKSMVLVSKSTMPF